MLKDILLFDSRNIIFQINHPTKAGGEFDWGGTSAKK
jgi:hypothetical protein